MSKKLTAVLTVILILTLCMALTACGETQQTVPTSAPTSAPTEKPTEKPTEAPTEEPTEPEPGVEVGDEFEYKGTTLTITDIGEGESDNYYSKIAAIAFSMDASGLDGEAPELDASQFKIDGNPATSINYRYAIKGGQMDYDNPTVIAEFKVNKDLGLEYLHLTVGE